MPSFFHHRPSFFPMPCLPAQPETLLNSERLLGAVSEIHSIEYTVHARSTRIEGEVKVRARRADSVRRRTYLSIWAWPVGI